MHIPTHYTHKKIFFSAHRTVHVANYVHISVLSQQLVHVHKQLCIMAEVQCSILVGYEPACRPYRAPPPPELPRVGLFFRIGV